MRDLEPNFAFKDSANLLSYARTVGIDTTGMNDVPAEFLTTMLKPELTAQWSTEFVHSIIFWMAEQFTKGPENGQAQLAHEAIVKFTDFLFGNWEVADCYPTALPVRRYTHFTREPACYNTVLYDLPSWIRYSASREELWGIDQFKIELENAAFRGLCVYVVTAGYINLSPRADEHRWSVAAPAVEKFVTTMRTLMASQTTI